MVGRRLQARALRGGGGEGRALLLLPRAPLRRQARAALGGQRRRVLLARALQV